jgi:hypothetical protein
MKVYPSVCSSTLAHEVSLSACDEHLVVVHKVVTRLAYADQIPCLIRPQFRSENNVMDVEVVAHPAIAAAPPIAI